MTILILGIVLSFNLIIIYVKIQKGRTGDAILDATALTILAIVFGGSSQSLAIGTVASSIISVFLYFNPPKFSDKPEEPEFTFK